MHDAEVKSTAQALRGQIREAKAQLELKLMRDIKGSKVKRDAYRYNGSTGEWERQHGDRQHRKGWSGQHLFFFAPVVTCESCSLAFAHISTGWEEKGIGGAAVREHWDNLHAFRPMESGRGHSRVLMLWPVARWPSIIYRKPWQAGGDPDDCKKVNNTQIFKIKATRRTQGTVGQPDWSPGEDGTWLCLPVPRDAGAGHLVLWWSPSSPAPGGNWTELPHVSHSC